MSRNGGSGRPSEAPSPLRSDDQPPSSPNLAKAPTTLAAFIVNAGIDAEIIAPGVPMPTVPLAAAAIGARTEQILKSLVFQDQATGRLVLAIACGTGRIDRVRLGAIVGLARLRLAAPDVVLAATGFPAGGVPPIGHASRLPVVMDRRAAALEVAYGGGGAEALLLRVRPADVLRVTDGIVADIVVGDETGG